VKLSLKKSVIGWKPDDVIPADSSSWPDVGVTGQIVTSTAVNDPALFEANLRDERYLPFENAGAVSQWTIALPATDEFDRQTISDVILHLRFVARSAAVAGAAAGTPNLPAANDSHRRLLASWRSDFSDQWIQLLATASTLTATATVPLPALTPAMTPYRLRLNPGTGAMTAASAWIVYRDAAGTRRIGVEIPLSGPLPAGTLAFDTSAPTTPRLVYAILAGSPVVEDVLIAFKV
jgi:hypothetical protein